jgi:hypothetical protein
MDLRQAAERRERPAASAKSPRSTSSPWSWPIFAPVETAPGFAILLGLIVLYVVARGARSPVEPEKGWTRWGLRLGGLLGTAAVALLGLVTIAGISSFVHEPAIGWVTLGLFGLVPLIVSRLATNRLWRQGFVAGIVLGFVVMVGIPLVDVRAVSGQLFAAAVLILVAAGWLIGRAGRRGRATEYLNVTPSSPTQ